jgi:hypothetical protein
MVLAHLVRSFMVLSGMVQAELCILRPEEHLLQDGHLRFMPRMHGFDHKDIPEPDQVQEQRVRRFGRGRG